MNYRRFGACAGYTLLSLCMVAPVWAASAAKVERLYQEGVNLRLEGRPAEASVIFSQALALQPDHVDLLLQQGLALKQGVWHLRKRLRRLLFPLPLRNHVFGLI